MVPRGQRGEHAQLSDWSFRVSANHAKTFRAHPLERLLFPFDGNPERRQTQPASIATTLADWFNSGNSCIAIETVCVRDQRPQFFWRRLEIEFPAIVKFADHRLGGLRKAKPPCDGSECARFRSYLPRNAS